MARKRYTLEIIVHKLREFGNLQGFGKSAVQAMKHTGNTEQDFCRGYEAYGVVWIGWIKYLRPEFRPQTIYG